MISIIQWFRKWFQSPDITIKWVIHDYTNIEHLKQTLIETAKVRHGQDITPCSGRPSLDECFSIINGRLYLWYNDAKTGSTHIVSADLPQAGRAVTAAPVPLLVTIPAPDDQTVRAVSRGVGQGGEKGAPVEINNPAALRPEIVVNARPGMTELDVRENERDRLRLIRFRNMERNRGNVVRIVGNPAECRGRETMPAA